jgi:hypothetical protein
MKEGRIQHHHSFKNSGWVSFYIKTEDDKEYAISLLKLGYDRYLESNVQMLMPGITTSCVSALYR